ncbi:hypothetical protein [Yersinia enterocolitica]|uniref:hypothetical protein n=1 Tax=Yersinia enterocolitica TaxID=630 RepID=UPI003D7ADBC8
MSGKTKQKQIETVLSPEDKHATASAVTALDAGGNLQLEQLSATQKPNEPITGVTGDTTRTVSIVIEDNRQSHELASIAGTQLGADQLELSQAQIGSLMNDLSQSGEVALTEVLLVSAVHVNGFYRCGQFWPHSGINVFVSDEPVADNDGGKTDTSNLAPFISADTAARLKRDPHLRVTVVPVVTGE